MDQVSTADLKACIGVKNSMAISISSSLSATPTVALPSSSTPATAQPTQKDSIDTVRLSQDAQVHLLKQQGQSLSQIATNLSISVATVDGYLGITVPSSTSVSTQPPAQVQDSSAKAPEAPTTSDKG
jgi:hypothetical protein